MKSTKIGSPLPTNTPKICVPFSKIGRPFPQLRETLTPSPTVGEAGERRAWRVQEGEKEVGVRSSAKLNFPKLGNRGSSSALRHRGRTLKLSCAGALPPRASKHSKLAFALNKSCMFATAFRSLDPPSSKRPVLSPLSPHPRSTNFGKMPLAIDVILRSGLQPTFFDPLAGSPTNEPVTF
jgi:hypothetical protein